MAESRRYSLVNQLDIEQILVEAQHRWLRPAEICEILQNHSKFRIAPEPANIPPSGSLFLFDRKVLRYFRKDGHNWRKKKDGKTVKEAHERLKAGSVDVLHCYYAHGEENENFQRRSYWMLEEDLSHIVLVHYLEVKGNRPHVNRSKWNGGSIPCSQETEDTIPNSEMDTSVSSNFRPNYQVSSQATDTISLSSAQASEYEDAESAYNQQASSSMDSFLELQQPMVEKIDAGPSNHYYPPSISNGYQGKLSNVPGMDFVLSAQVDRDRGSNEVDLAYETRKHLEFSWEDVLENSNAGIQAGCFPPSLSSRGPNSVEIVRKEETEILGKLFTDNSGKSQDLRTIPHIEAGWQPSKGESSELSGWLMDQKVQSDPAYDLPNRFRGHEVKCADSLNPHKPCHTHQDTQNDLQMRLLKENYGSILKLDSATDLTLEGKPSYSSAVKCHLLDGSLTDNGLKKLDSFNRWMSKELGDVNDLQMQSSAGAYWDTVEGENRLDDSNIPSQEQLDACSLGPSLSQDQLFSIIDFSPNWAYAGSEIKVLITGRFLKSQQEVENYKWSCMFGEVEVPAQVIADGVLRCYAPVHKAGRVPFYVTCSNRLACSEVREFQFQVNRAQDMDTVDSYTSSSVDALRMRFGKLLCLTSVCPPSSPSSVDEKSQFSSKIASLLKEDNDEWDHMLKLSSPEEVNEQLLQKLLKEKLHIWLTQKVAEGGKGPSILDEGGQGILHFAAALGYDWAIRPTIFAGVSANFRDVNGWTALHWAAMYGRERTVAFLVANGVAPGALTDPTPEYPSGRTPADLASANGHKGIAGYLAEASLSAHLVALNLDTKEGDAAETPGGKAVLTVSERNATPVTDGDLPYGLSMKDSLAAVCNATQAAARIHQVFRVQSFQKKQLKEYDDDKYGTSDEGLLSRIALKTHKQGQHDAPVHTAAVRIQNKFRSWKGRKDFLIIRQRIVKIQAHVRGHQVRKNYKKITWSVGILEKVILRWRRKGSGLRGFKPEAITEGSSMQDTSSKEDDFDFLKEGRKQTEQRLQKALARVKSMVQYPEARDQYRRLLNVVSEIQEAEVVEDKVINSAEETNDFYDDLIDLEALLDDDTFMPTAS